MMDRWKKIFGISREPSREMAAVTLKKRKVAFDGDAAPVAKEVISRRKGKQKATDQKTERTMDGARAPGRSNAATFNIIAGSYEKILYGLEGRFDSETREVTLKPIFIFPAHLSCIRALASSPQGGKWLVTGATDEVIKVWDLRRRKEVGGLVQHSGSITQLDFPTRSHMFSSSEDGTISAFRVRDWIPVRTLKGHKGAVNSFAIHRNHKVALSVGKDRMLRMWDLKKGASAASTRLGKEGESVRWSNEGKHFAILFSSELEIYSAEMKLVNVIRHSKRLHDFRFLRLSDDKEVLLVAVEDHKILVYPFDKEAQPSDVIPHFAFVGHQNRVKSIDLLEVKVSGGSHETLLASVSSDGKINLYNTSKLLEKHADELTLLHPIATYDTKGSRLTCVTLAEAVEGDSLDLSKSKKRARDELVSDDESEEGISGEKIVTLLDERTE